MRPLAIEASVARRRCSAPAGRLETWRWSAGCWTTERSTGEELPAALGHLQRHGKEAYDIAEALVAWGVPVNGGDRTLLQAFAHQGVHRTVAWLLAHGADVNARMPGGRTAAHLAAERNTGPATLALLVESGADLTARDDDGHTPLDIAKLNEKLRLVEWMQKRVRAKSR